MLAKKILKYVLYVNSVFESFRKLFFFSLVLCKFSLNFRKRALLSRCLHIATCLFGHFQKPGTGKLNGQSSSNLAVMICSKADLRILDLILTIPLEHP